MITEFVFRLHEVGPEVTAGLIAWSAEEAERVLPRFKEMAEQAPLS